MRTEVLEQMPAWYYARYGKVLAKRQVDQATSWVQRARRQTRRNAEREFHGRGFSLIYKELGFGGVRLRARLNIRKKTVTLDPESEADIFSELDILGFPMTRSPKELILTHELFHLFCPRCPSEIAELAAHMYCAAHLDLDYFPGLLDLAGTPKFKTLIA